MAGPLTAGSTAPENRLQRGMVPLIILVIKRTNLKTERLFWLVVSLLNQVQFERDQVQGNRAFSFLRHLVRPRCQAPALLHATTAIYPIEVSDA